jgi:PAS domain S-box-containing protein
MENMRNSGIDIVGKVPWGTHFCQFYKTEQDLLDILVPYFKTGLEANEFCMWVTSEPLTGKKALQAMAGTVPDFVKYLKNGQIEVLSYTEWYTKGGEFDSQRVLNGWVSKLDSALAKGYDGLRLTGNTFWLRKKDWGKFTDYENEIQKIIGQYRMMALCTYSLEKCGAEEVLDVVSNHKFALIRHDEKWALIESSDRKLIEKALKETEERFRVALKNSPIAVFSQDRDLRYVWVYHPTLGLDTASMIGKTDAEFFPPEDAARLTQIKRKALETGKSIREETWVAPDGKISFFDLTIDPVRDAAGQVVGITGASVNTTEQKLAERALWEERDRAQKYLDIAGTMIVVITADQKVSLINKKGCEILGRDESEIIGQNWFDTYVPEGERDTVRKIFEKLMAAEIKPVEYFENSLVTKTGEERIIAWHNTLMRDDNGNIVAILSSGEDITERKRAEKAKEEYLNRLGLLSDTASRLLLSRRPENIVEEICRKVMAYLDCQVFFNYLVDIEKQRLRLNAYGGISEQAAREFHWLELEKTLCGDATREACRIVVENIPDSLDSRTERVRSLGIKAYACHPLFSLGQVIGTLSFGTDSRLHFTSDELELMKIVADQVAVALERMRLIRVAQHHAEKLEIKVQQRTSELLSANKLLESLFSSMETSIAYMDNDFNFIRVNRAYAEADGKTPDFFIGKNHFELYPNKENEEIFKRAIETGEGYSIYEKPFIYAEHPERGVTYWDWRLQPLKDTSGRVNGLVLSLLDVTRRKLGRQERLRMAAAVEQASESIAILDAEGLISYVNPAFESVNGYLSKEVIGKKYEDILESGMSGESSPGKISRFFPGGEKWSGRLRRKKKDGQDCELDVLISPVFDPTGKIINYSVIERDVTQEVRLQQLIRQTQKMEALGTLAGGVAHDFNNILMTVGINTELSLLSVEEGSPLQQYLRLALEAVNRGKELVKQIITFSRQKEKGREPIKVSPIIKEAVKFLRPSLPRYIEIDASISTEGDIVLGDPTQIYQVLMNLCNNAAYAMRDQGGILRIHLTPLDIDAGPAAGHPELKPGPYVKLTVSDSGKGMEPEIIPRIFDPFFTTKKPGEGTGMGLAVVHGIIKSHGGVIMVSSEPGQGSTFDVLLPRADGIQVPESPALDPILTGRERILLVDDEEAQLRGVTRILETLGYSVTAKTDGLEALTLFEASPEAFDLVITDQTMPQMTGAKLAESLLKIRGNVPVILCTGFSELVGGEEAKAMGIKEFVMKPYSAREIAQAIRRVIDGA